MNQTASIIMESTITRFAVTVAALLFIALPLTVLGWILRPLRRARQTKLDRRRLRTAAYVLRAVGNREHYQ